MDLGLAGRAFLLTGASRGLGLAAAQALIAEGANVVIVAREPGPLDAAVAALGPQHCLGLAANLADPATPERVVAATIARYGRLDGCLVSVGGPAAGTTLNVTDEQWRAGFETVFLGALRILRAVAAAATFSSDEPPGSGPSMVAVLSTSVKSPIPGLAVSNGLRPGLAMVVKEMADELGGRGIRVNGLLPGRIATDRTYELDARTGSPEVARRRNEAAIPLGRYGSPAEFARVAAFLLSPAASYVNGTLLAVDGGALRAV